MAKPKEKPLKKILAVISYPAWLILAFLLAQVPIVIINIIFKDFLSNNIYKFIILTIFYALFIFLLIFAPHKFFKKALPSRKELGLKGTPTWTDILLAVVGFVAYILLSFILSKIFELFPFFDANQEQELMYSYVPGGIERILVLISLAFIPPIAEEIAFRGWLYPKLKNKISGKKSKIISIIIVSILFGFMHGQWNVGVGVFAMSVVACLMRELTGTIYSSILMHMIANNIAFYLLFVMHV